MNHLERNIHAELCSVAAIEGLDSLVTINSSYTVKSTAVGGVVHLETLLYNCRHKEGGLLVR